MSTYTVPGIGSAFSGDSYSSSESGRRYTRYPPTVLGRPSRSVSGGSHSMQTRPSSGVTRTIVGGPGGTSGEKVAMFERGLRSPPRRTEMTAYASDVGGFPAERSG